MSPRLRLPDVPASSPLAAVAEHLLVVDVRPTCSYPVFVRAGRPADLRYEVRVEWRRRDGERAELRLEGGADSRAELELAAARIVWLDLEA